MKNKKTKKVKKEANSEYNLILDMAGKKYEAKSQTIEDAIRALELSWEQIKLKGTITIGKDGHSYSHLFFPKQLRRIFTNKLTLMMWAKRLTLLFKETAPMDAG